MPVPNRSSSFTILRVPAHVLAKKELEELSDDDYEPIAEGIRGNLGNPSGNTIHSQSGTQVISVLKLVIDLSDIRAGDHVIHEGTDARYNVLSAFSYTGGLAPHSTAQLQDTRRVV